MEWNVREPANLQGGAGMWDTHIRSAFHVLPIFSQDRLQMNLLRTAGAAGTDQEGNRCPQSGAGGVSACSSAFLCLHLTPQSTAYLEVSRLIVKES